CSSPARPPETPPSARRRASRACWPKRRGREASPSTPSRRIRWRPGYASIGSARPRSWVNRRVVRANAAIAQPQETAC
ncbi:MAG: hypothetical protein AVDCRST_MAG40-3190, partial [uncultured Gemmatimonadaceae bacterium]